MIRKIFARYMGLPEPSSAADATEWESSDEATHAQLIETLYPQLKQIAERHMRRERHDHTLQPTALVSEFYLILARQKKFTVRGRAHFLAIASRAMRRLLIDHARTRGAIRHGGGVIRVQWDADDMPGGSQGFDMLEFDQLLDRLHSEDPRMAKVVELKCFGGLTFGEISEVLSIDERTAKRDWQAARAWLFGRLSRGQTDVP